MNIYPDFKEKNVIIKRSKFKKYKQIKPNDPKLWIIRVSDGKNLKNSKYPFWGVKRGRGGSFKTIVKKFKSGDILCFLTSKSYGGKIIGMAEYTKFYDREDEPLIKINTFSNSEQNWEGDDAWDIQIHYKNFYDTEKQNFKAIIQCSGVILDYDTYKDRGDGLPDLLKHYKNFVFYAEPKIFAEV